MFRIALARSLFPLLALFATPAAMAQSTSVLEVMLHAPRTLVSANETVVLQVAMTNTRKQGGVVLRGAPGFSTGGGLTLVVENSAGQLTTVPPTAGELTLEQARNGSRKVVLEPGHALSLQRRERASTLFPAPGTYRVTALYDSPSPSRGQDSPDELEGANGASNTVEITVR